MEDKTAAATVRGFYPVSRISPALIAGLVERAADNLTDDDLGTILSMDEKASDAFDHIHTLREGIAGLMLADEAQGADRTGCFQGAGAVFDLLTSIATYARRADERARAAAEARDILAERMRAAEGGFKPHAA